MILLPVMMVLIGVSEGVGSDGVTAFLKEKVPLLAQALSDKLHEIHEQSTSYSTLLSSYSSINTTVTPPNMEISDHPDSLGVLHKISERARNILVDRESKLRRKVMFMEREIRMQKLVNEEVVFNDSDFRRKGSKGFSISKYLPFPYLSHESSDVFIPIVKIMDNKTRTDISWTSKLIDFSNPPTFSYFIGTVNGLLRFYPGTEWPRDFDMYDCRLESWYLGAATSPHDVAILIDRSGSVSGISLRAIKKMAKLVINVIPEKYRMNVFVFSNETVPLKPCFKSGPVPATDIVKTAFLSLLNGIEPHGPGMLNDALTSLGESFFNQSSSTSCPKKVLILFTDGRISFSTKRIIETLTRMNVKLIVLDFSSPLAFGPNSQLKKLACQANGYYTFVKALSDWFRVADILSAAFSSNIVHGVTPATVAASWSDAVLSFHMERGIIVSLPLYNKTEDGVSRLQGVLGTELLLRDLQSSLAFEAGSLSYEVIALGSGRVISHPGILKTSKIISLSHVNVGEGSFIIYPQTSNIKRMIVAKIASVLRLRERGVEFQIVIPQNDAYKVSILPMDNEITRASEIAKTSGNTLIVKPSALHPFRFNLTEKQRIFRFNFCDTDYKTVVLKRSCPGHRKHVLPLLRDIIVTDVAFRKWKNVSLGRRDVVMETAEWRQGEVVGEINENLKAVTVIVNNTVTPADTTGYTTTASRDTTLGSFLITSRGVLRTTLSTYTDPLPRNVPEWVEFAAVPDRFPISTLLITDHSDSTGNVVLSKSVDVGVNDTSKVGDVPGKIVVTVTGTAMRRSSFINIVNGFLTDYGMGEDSKYYTYVLDHRGFIQSNRESKQPQFVGHVNSPLFKLLTQSGYYFERSFTDCTAECEIPVLSNAHSPSLFLETVLKAVISTAISAITQVGVFWASGVQGFIAPESHINKQCCQTVTTFERDFTVNNALTVTDYNKCDDMFSTETCLEKVAIHPLPATNLLLVVVVPNTDCQCGFQSSDVFPQAADQMESDDSCNEMSGGMMYDQDDETCFDEGAGGNDDGTCDDF